MSRLNAVATHKRSLIAQSTCLRRKNQSFGKLIKASSANSPFTMKLSNQSKVEWATLAVVAFQTVGGYALSTN